jgi:ribonucleoside-diphosphate reductase alpha chain
MLARAPTTTTSGQPFHGDPCDVEQIFKTATGRDRKTINSPSESTAEKSFGLHGRRKRGLKRSHVRDGSKRLQPVNTDSKAHKADKKTAKTEEAAPQRPFRRRLAETRHSITHKFSVAGHEGYLTVGLYEDGQPGELFITMAKEGSTVGGLMDVVGTWYPCPAIRRPADYAGEKIRQARFEPGRVTSNKNIPFAKSLIDYIFCWMGCQFIPGYARRTPPTAAVQPPPKPQRPQQPSRSLKKPRICQENRPGPGHPEKKRCPG